MLLSLLRQGPLPALLLPVGLVLQVFLQHEPLVLLLLLSWRMLLEGPLLLLEGPLLLLRETPARVVLLPLVQQQLPLVLDGETRQRVLQKMLLETQMYVHRGCRLPLVSLQRVAALPVVPLLQQLHLLLPAVLLLLPPPGFQP